MQHVGAVAVPGNGSPSPFMRTPRDDAPPYDPTLWEGRDFSFLTTYRETMQLNQRASAVRSMEQEFLASGVRGGGTQSFSENQLGAKSGISTAQPDLAALHVLPDTPLPLSFWGRVKGFLFGYRPKPSPLRTNLKNVPSDDLVLQMYAALRSGESEMAAAAAQELARRKTVLFDHALRTDAELSAGGAGKGERAAESTKSGYVERGLDPELLNRQGLRRVPPLPGTAAAFDARQVDVTSGGGTRPAAWQTGVPPPPQRSAESRVRYDGGVPVNRARERFSRSMSPPEEGRHTSRPRKTVHFFE